MYIVRSPRVSHRPWPHIYHTINIASCIIQQKKGKIEKKRNTSDIFSSQKGQPARHQRDKKEKISYKKLSAESVPNPKKQYQNTSGRTPPIHPRHLIEQVSKQSKIKNDAPETPADPSKQSKPSPDADQHQQAIQTDETRKTPPPTKTDRQTDIQVRRGGTPSSVQKPLTPT